MSVASIKTYFRTQLEALGYIEHTDGFNWENVANALMDDRFHVALGQGALKSRSNDNDEMVYPVTVRVFQAGNSEPKTAIDTSAARIDTIVADLLKASNRTLASGILNVSFLGAQPLPLSQSNDNGVLTEMTFNVLVLVSTI
jgi:hypothetical protein